MGAWPANYKDEYGKRTSLGVAQKLIWDIRNQVIREVSEDVDEIILVIMGDTVHGVGEDFPAEMESVDGKTQANAFLSFINPLAEQAKEIYVIDDASAHHVDRARFSNAYIAEKLGADGPHIKLDLHVQDLVLQLKHHGPPLGTRPHVRGDGIRRYLSDINTESVMAGRDAPDICVFGHWHQWWIEPKRVSTPKGHRILTSYNIPALCAADQRTLRNVKRLVLSDIGFLAIDVEGDEHNHRLWMRQFDNTVAVQAGESSDD